jgi:hypothetical protein
LAGAVDVPDGKLSRNTAKQKAELGGFDVMCTQERKMWVRMGEKGKTGVVQCPNPKLICAMRAFRGWMWIAWKWTNVVSTRWRGCSGAEKAILL